MQYPRTRKAALLSVVICVSTLTLGGQVWAHWRKMSPAPASTTIPDQRTIPQMLVEINQHLNPKSSPYLNSQRVDILRAELAQYSHSLSMTDRLTGETRYADELTNAGKTEEALKVYRSLEQEAQTETPQMWKQGGPVLLTHEAVAYLRMGELQNCCDRNNPNSCLLPISGSGVHTRQEGSRNAIRCLLASLKMQPDNLSARWLLNIAYMTVGEYPQKVPARWLIPLKDYGGEFAMPKFTNVAPLMGLDLLGLSGSVIMEDFEGKGLLDLMVSSFDHNGQLRFFHNNGDGTFTERTKEAGLTGEIGGLNIVTTDYNNDGRPDVIVLRGGWMDKDGHYPLSLLRNDGNGHFTDVTLQTGLLTIGPTQTAVAFDYNGDGNLDLFVGYESTPGDPVPCKLFRNNGNGTFTDVTEQCGLHVTRFVKAVISSDFTHNGRPGLYLSCAGETNILLRNDGPAGADKSPTAPWKFTDVTLQAGVDLQQGSFSCFFFDFDNDSWPDIYVGGYGGVKDVGDVAADYLGQPTPASKAKLYHNNHDGTFSDVSKQAHLDKVIEGMGINFGDLDNDGWLDFYVGTGNPDLSMLIPNRMFHNNQGKGFQEVTTSGDFGHLQKGHGIAFGDLNNNGQQDIFLVAGGAYEGDTAHDCLFLNPGNKNHWVTLQLTGVKSNRIAMGSEICLTLATPHGDRQIYKTVSTGGSFGNSPLRQEFGLGDATAIKQVAIHWPASGSIQILKNLSLDRFYKIKEGEPNAEPWQVPTFKLPSVSETAVQGTGAKTASTR